MLLSWLARRRRTRLFATPFPDEWLTYLERNVPLYSRLTESERAKLRDDLRVLVAEKNWEGCGGFALTDEAKVTVAAHAALLLLGIAHDYFARVQSILIYPSGYRSPDGWMGPDGVVHEDDGRLGEAWYDGPVVLAWDSVLAGGQNPRDGQNVVLHEFAHQLDYLDGVADGTPVLKTREQYKQWHEVMTTEYERLKVEAAHGHPKVLDEYGATNPAEFFAVATECFFEKAKQMCARHPRLYDVLSGYYNQDPAARRAPTEREPQPADAEPQPREPNALRPHRRSRAPAKTAAHARVALDWPGWVTFWELHPGMPREYARRPFEHHFVLAMGSLFLLGLSLLVGYRDRWVLNAGMILSAALLLAAVVFAAWLWLAIRWVDRHGIWACDTPQRPVPPPP